MGNIIEIIDDDNNSKFVNRIPGLELIFKGKDNHVTVHSSCKFNKCVMQLGSRNIIDFKKSKYLINSIKLWSNSDTVFKAGTDFTCIGLDVRLQENKTGVQIGDDCLFSYEICFYPTDGHAIYSQETGDILNLGKIISIGNHVWCGRRVTFLKSAKIPSNCVLGFGSTIMKEFNNEYSVIAGNPAQVIKEGINWSRLDPWQYKCNSKN